MIKATQKTRVLPSQNVVCGLGTRLPVCMRTKFENGVLRNGQQLRYMYAFVLRVRASLT